MSLATNLSNAFTRVATEMKAHRVLINGNAADLSGLTTTAKTSLMAAINELDAAIDEVSAGAAGIDDAVTSTTTTWSSQKTADELIDLKNEILGGAGPAFDTLQELKDLLDAAQGSDADAITAINAALANRVRTDTNAQGLDATQRQNARTNIDVHSTGDIGDVNTNFVAVFEAGLV